MKRPTNSTWASHMVQTLSTGLNSTSGKELTKFRVCALKGHNTQHMVIWDNFFQTELMVEIYSKSRVRAIGKVRITCEI